MADCMAGINSLHCLCMKASFYLALTWKELIVAGIDCFMAWWWWGCAPLTQRHASVLSLRNNEGKWGCEEVWRLHTPRVHPILPLKSCTKAWILESGGSSLCNICSQHEPHLMSITQLLFCVININTLQMWANEPDAKLHCSADQILLSGQPLLLVIWMQRL